MPSICLHHITLHHITSQLLTATDLSPAACLLISSHVCADESSSPFGWSASSPPTEQLSDRWAHDDDSSQREHERLRDASSPHESSPVAESPPSVAESSTPSAESLPTASQPQAAARDFGEAIIVDRADLHKYIGQPPFSSDKIYTDDTPPGVVMGLAWTAMGGNSLYIEAASISKAEGKGSIRCTGQPETSPALCFHPHPRLASHRLQA